MMLDDLPPAEVMWAGKYVRALKRGQWEYVSRANDIRAVVILAEFEGKVILIDQPRVAVGGRCVELPAGLVGDQDPAATPESTAIKELEEEAGFTAERVERLGDFHGSPGMLVRKLHPRPRARRAADRGWGRRRERGDQCPPGCPPRHPRVP
jgi:ADP-ribose pyrophosphatase